MSREAWPVSINGTNYQVDLDGLVWRPINRIRDLQDQGAEPTENSLSLANTWKRSARNWSMGCGQDWFDENDSFNDRRRFRASKNLDIWTDRELSLLPIAASAAAIGTTGDNCGLKRAGTTYVYGYSGGSAFHIIANGTVTACTGESGTFSDMTVWDGYVYFAGSGTLQRVAVGGTAVSTFGSLTPDLIEATSGRLLAADGVDLYEINASGAKQGGGNIYSHVNTSWTWDAIEGAPNGIYVAGNDGYTSTVYLVPVVDATGDLVAPYPVLPLPPGEIVREITSVSGLIMLATNRGVRMCQVNSSGFLGMGPVITDLGDVKAMTADGNYIYCGWSAEPIDGHVAVARIGPDRWTEQMVPRYACDVSLSDTGTVNAVAVLDGQVFFMYDDGAATDVVFAHPTNKSGSGQLHTGGITFLTPEDKRFFMMEAVIDALPAGASMTMNVRSYPGYTAGDIMTLNTEGQTEETQYDSTPLEVEAVEIAFHLYRATDTTTGPIMRRWTIGATPIYFAHEEIILPIIIKSEVAGVGAAQSLGLYSEWSTLHALMLSQERVAFTFGDYSTTVTVNAIATEPTNSTSAMVDWNTGFDWPEGIWLVRLLTQEA